ncbi:MAG: site-2 protease family protein [Clostridia bacterium]|nr:site-2 protease family protein [Clostridia bacterium]
MTTVLYVLLALLVFSLMIFVHELGHYIFARRFGVTIEEFSIGMGPKLLSRKSKKTGIVYSLRAFPMGGFVSMVGEDEESDDENALSKKPAWQRLIIMVAGAAMNILLGVILMFTLVCSSNGLATTTVAQFMSENAITYQQGLREGDVILKINKTPVHIGNELVYEIMQQGTETAKVTILRDGVEMTLDIDFPTTESEGILFGTRDFYVTATEKTVGGVLKHTLFRSTSTVKMIWESLIDLISGKYGIQHISGPVGVTQVITDAARTGIQDLLYIAAVICINLGVFNLLPIPALDGGRAVFLLVEVIRRKPISPKIEGYVHTAGLILLLLFMVIVSFKDVFQLIF